MKKIVIGVMLLGGSGATWALPINCVTTSATSVAAAGSQTGGIPIATSGSGNTDDFASLNGNVLGAGCATVDSVFSTFTATGTGVTDAGTYISVGVIGGNPNQDFASGFVESVFSTVRGADNGADGTGDDGSNQWAVPSGTASTTFTVDDQLVTSGGAVLNYAAFDLAGTQIGAGGGGILLTIDLCLGGTWSSGGTGGTCSSGAGNIQLVASNSSTLDWDVKLSQPATTIGIQVGFVLDAPGSGATWVTALDEGFGEAPEPSTFVLLGTALAGIGLLGARRKKA